jgi:hypothetical protein
MEARTTQAEQAHIQAVWVAEQARQQARYSANIDEVWARRMGRYTDRTLTDVYENVFNKWEDKGRRKTLTLNERYILWKIKELNWERLVEYYPDTIRGWKTTPNPFCVVRGDYVEYDPETGEPADTGMTFDDWVKYRKLHKIRTFL